MPLVFAAHDGEAGRLRCERQHHAVIQGDPAHGHVGQAARRQEHAAAFGRIRIPQRDTDALTAGERLHARHDGIQNVLEFNRPQQQLIDLGQRFERPELLIQADGAAIECLDEDSRLIRRSDREHTKLAHAQGVQRYRQIGERRHVAARKLRGSKSGARQREHDYEYQGEPGIARR